MHHCECVVPLDIESPEVIILSFNNSFEKLSLPITQVCTIMWEAMFCQDDQLVISNHQTRQKSVWKNVFLASAPSLIVSK